RAGVPPCSASSTTPRCARPWPTASSPCGRPPWRPRLPYPRMTETILTDARIVTRDDVFDGTVVVRDGRIAEIQRGSTAVPGALRLDGDYLLPGLVELHTDNLEKHLTPRPRV